MNNNKCLKVPKKKAEQVRKKLISLNYLGHTRKIFSDSKSIFFPLNSNFVRSKIKLGTVSAKKLIKIYEKPKSVSEVLSKKLTKTELAKLKTSFDVFGDVIVVEIPPELSKKEKIIGESFLKIHTNARAVFKKTGSVRGIERVRPLKKIAGTGTSVATYKESGCIFKFDIKKVFFSPRLSTERETIFKKVKSGETVLDMFAGAGPFSITIAKKQALVKKVIAVDINSTAIDYLNENAKINKVSDKITAYVGDSRLLATTKLKGIADRIIMNLPKTSINFLPSALKALNPKGGTIHYYTFKSTKQEVRAEVQFRLKSKKFKILTIRTVKSYAPREYCFCADIKIYK
jgi:tRNA (guanine37-N1)-methyltransferase